MPDERGDTTPAPGAVTEAQALANAERAYAELRAQIALQIGSAQSLDTKAAALAALLVAGLGFVAGRLDAQTPVQIAAAAIGAALVVALAACLVQALRPGHVSYGADPDTLRNLVDATLPHALALSLVDSLAASRKKNEGYMKRRAEWYAAALATAAAVVIVVGAMAQTGAIR